MSGAEWPVTLSDVLLTLGDPAAAVRSHQGRASRREISYRPPAVADRVRRGGGRIRAVAEVRHLDLFPADAAGAGGFPLRPCIAHAAPCRRDVGARAFEKERAKAEAPVAEPVPEPAPAPAPPPPAAAPVARSAPAAASVAESVLRDHPEPKPEPSAAEPRLDHSEPKKPDSVPELTHPAAPDPASPELPLPDVPSPDVPSPELQPGGDSPPKPDTPPRKI